MKVILQKTVASLGEEGEVKIVNNGYARNYLLPRNLVREFTKNSAKSLKHLQTVIARKKNKQEKRNLEVAEKLRELGTITIQASVAASGKLYGSVTSFQIAEKLHEHGFLVHRNKIDLLGTRIRTLGDYPLRIKLLANEKQSDIKITLHVIPLDAPKKQEQRRQKTKIRSIHNSPSPRSEDNATVEQERYSALHESDKEKSLAIDNDSDKKSQESSPSATVE